MGDREDQTSAEAAAAAAFQRALDILASNRTDLSEHHRDWLLDGLRLAPERWSVEALKRVAAMPDGQTTGTKWIGNPYHDDDATIEHYPRTVDFGDVRSSAEKLIAGRTAE